MEIRVVEAPPTPPKRKTPAQVAKGRKTVPVFLEAAITLELDGSTLVTYSPGEHAAPCEVANALVAAGAELVGSDGARRPAAEKAARSKFPGPTRGGVAGSVRFAI